MYLYDGIWVCSPTDLSNAVACEFAVLRDLDVKLHRWPSPDTAQDAMLERTARLGDAHEDRVLRRYQARFGPYDAATGSGVATLVRPERGVSAMAVAVQTLEILRSGADVVYQAAFLRGRFTGYADFLVRQDDGAWAVYDTKLARRAKVSALLQLAAYGDELLANGISVAPQVHLILGDESTSSHELHEIIPVYRERRARLEALVDWHVGGTVPATWGDPRITVCGRCNTCAAEVAARRDVLMVAGMRLSQRGRLHEADVVTIDQLAIYSGQVPGVSERSLRALQAQAALQVQQVPPDGPAGDVAAQIHTPDGLAAIPADDIGDIFFDFEGDPLWSDGDPTTTGLEYLFGVVEVDTGAPVFRAFWAHNRAEERTALQQFLEYVEHRLTQFPAMHIYHYAAYERSALLRLTARYGIGEAVMDDLLRQGLLVDLYAVVRNTMRVSQPSYSLKALEPLYMGQDLRDSDVKNAGDSIAAYVAYCELRDSGQHKAARAALESIADYNAYDCRSTLGLRDWLRARALEHGVVPAERAEAPSAEPADDAGAVAARLVAQAGDIPAARRSPEQQAVALLGASVGYHRREMKPFWWAHYDRLTNPIDVWAEATDVLVVDGTEVDVPWGKVAGKRNERRTLRLTGRLPAGSLLGVGTAVLGLYDASSIPDGVDSPPGSHGTVGVTIRSRAQTEDGLDILVIEEAAPTGVAPWPQMPIALVPDDPIRHASLQAAILDLAEHVAGRLERGEAPEEVIDSDAVLRLLARRTPSLDGSALPFVRDDDYITALTAAVRGLDGSCLAVQGPPGSGKTYVGAQVIKALVRAGWRIGVVAQSHKVIENLLGAVATAGVPAGQIGKKPSDPKAPDPRWTALPANADVARFLAVAGAAGTGCVLGGTAWDLTNLNRVARGELDLVVIDEAGQFSLANTIAVSTAARNLLLLGDPQQLPQVSQGTHPEPCDESALAWVAGDHRVMPPELGYFLARTWRMHPALAAAVSQLAYDGELRANEAVTASRSLAGVKPGIRVIEVDHVGNSVESTEEADAVVAAVRDLIGRIWTDPHTTPAPRPLDGRDILVVAPYNAQVAMIRRRLDAAGHTGVQVGSVDRFQGQEAPVVIVSMTASAPEDVPRGMDFLLSRNRVNVAVSRGQWTAVIVRSPRLTDYLPTHPDGLTRLGAFLRLCASPGEWA